MRLVQRWTAVLSVPWMLLALTAPVTALAPLFLVDEATTVRSISFRFAGPRTFADDQLQARLATSAPGVLDRLRQRLPFLDSPPFPFSPLELQRDVARLRAFYHGHGFPRVDIGYATSRLDTASNTLSIAFTIDAGPPLRIRTLAFENADGSPLAGSDRQRAAAFRRTVTVREGDRYGEFLRLRTRDQVLAWLRGLGYAFAQVQDSVDVDSTALTVGLRLYLDPGPLATFGDVQVEGNKAVSRRIIVRELPFRRGQLFSSQKLARAQHELYALDLFRTALVDLPAQARDSTVTVRVRVRETKPQLITYQVGFGREAGITLQGAYAHRNFGGAARELTTTLVANSGYGAAVTGGRLPARLFRTSVALRQPYLFTTKLSGTIGPFVQYGRDPQLEQSARPLGINAREFGVDATLVYELLPFRTLGLQYRLSRALLYAAVRADSVRTRDPFSLSIVTLGGTFGRVDDYLNPTQGYLVRPALEVAGRLLASGVRYTKASTGLTGILPLSRRTAVAARLFVGRIWPVGHSRQQQDPVVENRFDPIRFYSGGVSDLHGWADGLAGPKGVRIDVAKGDTLFSYEPVGGLAKVAAGLELRLPFAGLGPNWGTAVFFDAGRVGAGLGDRRGLRYGTGAAIRYRAPVGFVSLEGAYKINPDARDLRSAGDSFRSGTAASPSGVRRLAVYLSLVQSF